VSNVYTGPALRTVVKALAMPTLGLVVGLGAAGGVTVLLAPTYQASASVMIMATATGDAGTIKVTDVGLAQNLAPSIARLAESREVAVQAATALKLPVKQVEGHISGVSEPGIQIVTVHTTAPTAAGAAAMANAATEAMRELCERLRLGGQAAITVGTLDRAGVPDTPVSPKVPLNYALGALVGVLAGLGLGSLRTRVDDRFRRVADIEAGLGLPALGVLKLSRWRALHGGPRRSARPELEAAVDATLAAVSVLNPLGSRRRIVVTSVGDQDSAAVVATLLAAGLCRQDHPTTLMEGLSRPATTRRYVPNHAEHTVEQILTGRRGDAEALAVLPIDAVRDHLGSAVPRGDQLGSLLDALAAGGDYVVVTAPPVMAGSGLCALARHADVVLLVVASDQARKAEAGRAALLVQRLGVPLAGLVVIGGAAAEDGWRPASWPAAEIPSGRVDPRVFSDGEFTHADLGRPETAVPSESARSDLAELARMGGRREETLLPTPRTDRRSAAEALIPPAGRTSPARSRHTEGEPSPGRHANTAHNEGKS
jgi:capsular polysaccharide biosynthesis protein/Mrp family chromosome partitioning ATPase